jgi:hypothetical protein
MPGVAVAAAPVFVERIHEAVPGARERGGDGSGARRIVAIVLDSVVLGGELERVHVLLRRGLLRARLHAHEVGNRDRRQDPDHDDHDHQLDQRESALPAMHRRDLLSDP